MTDHITRVREQAHAESREKYPDIYTLDRSGERLAFTDGAVWLASRLTRENIEEIIYANTEQIDHCGYGLMVVDDPLELADEILALMTNEPKENVLDCKREEESK